MRLVAAGILGLLGAPSAAQAQAWEYVDGPPLYCIGLSFYGAESAWMHGEAKLDSGDLEGILRMNIRGPARFADLVAAYLHLPLPVKRAVASSPSVTQRLALIVEAIEEQLDNDEEDALAVDDEDEATTEEE